MDSTLRDATEELDSLQPALNVTRRGFVQTSLGAGFAAAVLPVSAQTMITTDTQGLTAGEVKIPTKDGEMPAYRAMPTGKTGLPTVLVVQEVFGVHEHIKDVARRLAKQGYLAIAPELYARQGDPTKYTDTGALMKEIVSKVSDAQVMADLDATAAWAAKNGGGGKLGITGFCWGGRIVLMYAAHNPNLAAAVAWYGPTARSYHAGDKTALDVAGQIKAPVLGLYRRRRRRYSERHRRKNGRRAEGRRQHTFGNGDLSEHAARVLRRLPSELPQGSCRRRLEAADGVVQAVSLVSVAGLTALLR